MKIYRLLLLLSSWAHRLTLINFAILFTCLIGLALVGYAVYLCRKEEKGLKLAACLMLWIGALSLCAFQTHTFPALDTNNSFTGSNTICILNGAFLSNTACYATIQAAITAAGTTGAVVIPANYAGVDTFTNPNNIPIEDLRTSKNSSGGDKGYINARSYGVMADASTDDAAAINASIAAAVSTGVGVVQLPCGQIVVKSAINLTNRNNLTFRGCGTNQQFAGNYGIVNTFILCETGTQVVCMDTNGSSFLHLQGFTLRGDFTKPTPSCIGILMGRNNATLQNQFSEFNEIDQVYIFMDSHPACSARGTVAVYDVGAEHCTLTQSKLVGDEGGAFADTNVLSIASPFQAGFSTGVPASMTLCTMNQTSVTAQTQQGFELWNGQSFFFLNDHVIQGSAAGFGFSFNAICNNNKILGQYENLPQIINIASGCTHLYVDAMAVSPTAAMIEMQVNATCTGCYLKMVQVNGSTQNLIHGQGSNTIQGSLIDVSGSAGINSASSLTLKNSTVFGGALNSSAILVGSASTYLLQANDVTSFIGGQTGTMAFSEGCNGTATSSQTLFLDGPGAASYACTDTGAATQKLVMPSGGTIKNLRVLANTGGFNASSGVVTLRKNGSDQAVTCTLGTGTICNDTTHSFAVVAGDGIVIKYTTQATETLAGLQVSFEKQ